MTSKPDLGKPIRVLVVDDHAMVRSGLAAFLLAFDDLELVGEASDGNQAIRLCEQLLPDVVLMDLVMPGLDGVTTTEIIQERWPDVHVIALTSFQEEERVRDALRGGAISYLLKHVSPDELAEAIRQANRGNPTLAAEAFRVLVQGDMDSLPLGHDLTPREQEVLALLVEGLTNGEIASSLTVSISTVKYHVSNILSKLHASSRAEAITLAHKNRLVR